ncbi:MAG TPA: carboxypeptidase-like regulatory domain-containing protein, partial [Polyangiaceae bacterium]|nr:carboxypeptidase-like regulatory domain-containing protein [Polyangiaceae bacterium]
MIDLDAGSNGGASTGPCTAGGWQCKIDECQGQSKTTVRAKVYDPAGLIPLYDVAVYVPNATVAPIDDGATCETCATPVSGQPIASALTDAQGEFVLEDVPTGSDVPLVIQIGKWRRQVTLPEVLPCQENAFDDPATFRLPRNQSEGHLPKIAMTTGEADSLECLLMRIGVDQAEFTNPDGPGRVNLFQDPCINSDCDTADTSYADGSGTFPVAATTLYNSAENLMKYDIILMSCRGSQSAGRDQTSANKQALKSYVDNGGRVFLEHYGFSWLRGGNESPAIEDARKYPATPFPVVATWDLPTGDNIDVGDSNPVDYTIDTSFPKGNDFADWLVNVGASPGGKGVIT